MVTLAFIPRDNDMYGVVVVRRYTAIRSRMTAFTAPDGPNHARISFGNDPVEDHRVQTPSPDTATVTRTLKKGRRTNRTNAARASPAKGRPMDNAVKKRRNTAGRDDSAKRRRAAAAGSSSIKGRRNAAARDSSTKGRRNAATAGSIKGRRNAAARDSSTKGRRNAAPRDTSDEGPRNAVTADGPRKGRWNAAIPYERQTDSTEEPHPPDDAAPPEPHNDKPPSPEYIIEPELCVDIWDDGSSDEPKTPENRDPVDMYAPSDEEPEPDDQIAISDVAPEITSCDIAESDNSDDDCTEAHRGRIRRILSRDAPSSEDDEPDPLPLDLSDGDDDDTPFHEPDPLPDDDVSFFRRIHIKPPTDPSMTDYKLMQRELNTLAARFTSDESGTLTRWDRSLLNVYDAITTPSQ